MPLLRLDESHTLESALQAAEDAKALGLVEKGNAVAARYAVRFRALGLLESYAMPKPMQSIAPRLLLANGSSQEFQLRQDLPELTHF